MRRQPNTEYLAECLWPGVTEADVRALDVRVQASAAAIRDTKARVRYLGAMLVAVDDVAFFFFTADSALTVEMVARHAGIPFERVVESTRISPIHQRR
jgi:hypothetical protein